MAAVLRAPFPWFGGKSRAAPLVWAALGDVSNYVEPFAGSLAVLLARPTTPRVETVNDLDAYLANFWRAVAAAPEEVARHADWPVNEADLHARHAWLVAHHPTLRALLDSSPDAFDAKVAGWWLWGVSQWIGDGWCGEGRPSRKIPNVDGQGNKGVHAAGDPRALMLSLSRRLRRVRVACGDWRRVLASTPLRSNGKTGVVLDPPYADGAMDYAAGGMGSGISSEVRAWAIENGADPALRIVLCGYEGEHAMPKGWRSEEWTASRGFATSENENRHRERLWFSPHCLDAAIARQPSLFGGVR
jgi:hypothetical protein